MFFQAFRNQRHTRDMDHHERQHHFLKFRQVFMTEHLAQRCWCLLGRNSWLDCSRSPCAAMVPVKRLGPLRQAFVKQAFCQNVEGWPWTGVVASEVAPDSLSNPVAVLSWVIQARTLHATLQRGRNQAEQHLLVRVAAVGRALCGRAVVTFGLLNIGRFGGIRFGRHSQRHGAGAEEGQALASTTSLSLRARRHL